MRWRRAAAVILAAGGAGCGSDTPAGGITPPTRSIALPAGAALVFASDLYSPGSVRELYSLAADGNGLTRLTQCQGDPRGCDTVGLSPAPDRRRLALRRTDPSLGASDEDAALVLLDLPVSATGLLVPASDRVSGMDWIPGTETLFYSGRASDQLEHLFQIDASASNKTQSSNTPGVSERRPHVNRTGSAAVFEHIETGQASQVWLVSAGGT